MNDPYLILNVSRTPTDDEVRSAYLKAVRQNPPDQNPEHFQAIQRAYEAIKTHRLRLKSRLLCSDVVTPTDLLAQALQGTETTTNRPGLAQFQAVLRSGFKSNLPGESDS